MELISTPINQTVQLDDSLYMITEAGSIHCYLMVGTEKALLLDVGYGYENILPLVRAITPLPLMVVLSHGDPDHALGSSWFTDVYLHPLDLGKLFLNDNLKLRTDSLNYRLKKRPDLNGEIDVERFLGATVKGITPHFLHDGDQIDLGGIVLEVIHTPGHSYGHIALLDRAHKRLFSGDAVTHHNVWYFLGDDQQAPFSMALAAYERLLSLKDSIELIYPAHGETPIKTDILQDLVDCLSWELAENYQNDQPFHSFAGNGYQHFYKRVNLIYSDHRLAQLLGKRPERTT